MGVCRRSMAGTALTSGALKQCMLHFYENANSLKTSKGLPDHPSSLVVLPLTAHTASQASFCTCYHHFWQAEVLPAPEPS